MRQMLTDFINQILSAQADSVCGAEYATAPPDRINKRNGYRHRRLDTRAGSINVAVPKLRTGGSSQTGYSSVKAGLSAP